MILINKTPHAINIADADGQIVRVIEPTPPAARVSITATTDQGDDTLDGVPFRETVFGAVENLPPQKLCSQCHGSRIARGTNGYPYECDCTDAVYYIVSAFVISALPRRTDLVRPDTGPTCVRDATGQIVAVRALTR